MSNLIPITDKTFLKGWKTHLVVWSPVVAAKLAGLAVFLGVDVGEETISKTITDFIGVAENSDVALASLVSWARGLPPQIKTLLGK